MSTMAVTSTHRLRQRRRFSTTDTVHDARILSCQRLPHSLEALDLSSASAKESLGTLRVLVLSYLEDVETRLSKLESPLSDISIPEAFKIKGEYTAEEARIWARDALEMLRSIRSDVCSHLPELPDVPSLSDVRTHLTLSLADITSAVDDARLRFSDTYISTLSARLQSLQIHLRSMDVLTTDFHSLSHSKRLSGLVESFMSSELVAELTDDVIEVEDMALDIARAVKQSLQGSKLIHYVDLPPQWRNNRFVTGGYRYVFTTRTFLADTSCYFA
jgi:adiponectin receptor